MNSDEKSLELRPKGTLSPTVSDDLEHAADLASNARAESTIKAYETDIRAWKTYAKEHGMTEFPVAPSAFAAFVGHLSRAGFQFSSIRRKCAAMAQWHRSQRKISPTDDPRIRDLMRGLARTLKMAPKKKRALTADMVRKMVQKTESPRDKAILLVGFCTGMRRSEMAAMKWEYVQEVPEGLVIFIPESKTDQEGKGAYVVLPKLEESDMCPVAALEACRKSEGSVFGVVAKTIYRVVKRRIEDIGLDPTEFGAHSFRSGFVTEARRSGATLDDIMEQTRHKTSSVAREYIQKIDLMENPAVRGVLERLRGKEEDRQ